MIEKIYNIFQESSGICTDTRAIEQDNLFFALQGPNFNANKFAAQALADGAICAIIDDMAFDIPGKTIFVDDALTTLQELAKLHRNTLKIPILGITGSNGKTTTKELIAAVLGSSYNTFATRGNLNNHIGVPLSVLSITREHEIAIIEMGANHIGEIAQLSSICRPTHGIITNIGKAHTGLFGGFEGVIRAKSELYDFLIKNKATVFINQNQEILMNMSKRFESPVFYPNPESYYSCKMIGSDPFVWVETELGNTVKTNLVGSYNFDNIATALCIGKYFNVSEEKARHALASYSPRNNRSQIINKGSNIIILDAYNANPTSMEKALENLAQMKVKSKLVIIGDMFELGEDSKAEHQTIGKLVKDLNFTNCIFCGESMKFAYESCGRGHYFKTRDLLIDFLKNTKFSETTLLIKASRGMALEGIVEYL